jgi:hypothetical protein
MHYRISKVKHAAGARESMISHLESMSDKIHAIAGLYSVKLVEISETESIAFSKYDNAQQVIDAEDQFREIMGGMMQFMTGPPEIMNGDVIWQVSK